MTVKYLTNFKNSIDKSVQLQLDYLICKFLHKTPAEVRELEKNGLLTFEQKIFIQAGMVWERQNNPGCPFLG